MPIKLSNKEIKRRLQKLENYERLYPQLKKKYKQGRIEIKELRIVVIKHNQEIERLKLIIEELQKIIFGKKNKKNNKKDDDCDVSGPKARKKPRTSDSYQRSVPIKEEITKTKHFHIEQCPQCKARLKRIKTIVRYIEDIAFLEKLQNLLKKVEKQLITTGYCSNCKTRVSAKSISKQKVSLGKNVKQFVVYSNIILRLSFEQIQNLLKDLANFSLSDGEISNILKNSAQNLLPQYEQLKKRIRGQPGAHYDETTWKVQQEEQGNFAWVMTGTKTMDTIFLLGRSRGTGNARELKGKNNNQQVGISDGFGVYKKLFKYHQLCWSHPQRKLRDLKNSKCLDTKKKKHCQKVYEMFSVLYQDVNKTIVQDFNLAKRRKVYQKLMKRLEKVSTPNKLDFPKLITIKKSLRKNKKAYFTCILIPGIPADNNKAERALRHLVLKRKISYGSKTQKGAEVMKILFSVLLSLWWKRPNNFFKEFSLLFKEQ